ncbi:MAG: hypothetical protein LW822_00010 [Phycisphaeraceae bacterium]|jgi:hypothetical protein|nr:hypothetical protein [Phycisphaeraceae bacterium]
MGIGSSSGLSVAAGSAAYLARAYGVKSAGVVARVAPEQPVAPLAEVKQQVAAGSGKLGELVGAVVPGGVDFSGQRPVVGAGAPMAFYSRPSERNEVATVLSLGKRLDVVG